MSRFLSYAYNGLTPYTPGEQPADMAQLVKLNTNENPFPPAPGVIRALNSDAVRSLRLYNDPTAAKLTAAMAVAYGLQPQQVFFGNGSDEVLALAFMAFGTNGLSFADITYGFYPVLAGLYRLYANIIPLHSDFTLHVEDYDGTEGAVVIANPNAPTGIALPVADVEALLQKNRNRLVIVDEAYVDFGGESAVPLIEQYDNLLVVGTFSKSRSLAGARLGYALGSAALIADLNRIKFSFHPYNVNALTQAAGTAALEDKIYFEACCTEVAALREYLAGELKQLGCKVLPSKANFLFVNPVCMTGEEFFTILRHNKILVRHFDDARIADFVRISVGTKDDMDLLIKICKKIFKDIQS